MKYPNWSQAYANDPNNEAYDKMAKKVTELASSSISEDACFYNIKEELNLIYFLVAPITEELQTFHHLTHIGGNISMPDSILVALIGFGPSSIPIRLPETHFKLSNDVTIPAWKKLKKFASPKDVLDLKLEGGSVISFRNIVTIPPLLALAIIASSSSKPEDLFIECLTAATAYDLTPQR